MTGCYSSDKKKACVGPSGNVQAEVDGYERTEKLGIQLLIHHFTKQKETLQDLESLLKTQLLCWRMEWENIKDA